jgi:hypothetical protein
MKIAPNGEGKITIEPLIGPAEIGEQIVNPGTNSDLPPRPNRVEEFVRGDFPKTADYADEALEKIQKNKALLEITVDPEARKQIIARMGDDVTVAKHEATIHDHKKKLIAGQQQETEKLEQKRRAMAQAQLMQKLESIKAHAHAPPKIASWATQYLKIARRIR